MKHYDDFKMYLPKYLLEVVTYYNITVLIFYTLEKLYDYL